MQPEIKFSKFMFHLKFSNQADYVNEHELYEVMRSRNLYQTQFGVRSNYKKVMRNLAKDEKQRKYNFENTRKIFVQKMKERREQVDKLRSSTTGKLNSLSIIDDKDKKIKRHYVPLPQSTVVYTELPAIIPEAPYPISAPIFDNTHMSERTTLPPAGPTPSMIATNYTNTDEEHSPRSNIETNTIGRKSPEHYLTAKVMVAGRHSARTRTAKTLKSRKSDEDIEDDTLEQLINNEELVDELRSLKLDHEAKNGNQHNNAFENNAKLGKGKAQTSTVYFTDEVPSKARAYRGVNDLTNELKAKVWAEKHGIVTSQANIMKEQDFQRLIIDRPSKWALNHIHQEGEHSKILDMRLRYSRGMLNESFKRKSRKLDALSQKLNLHHRISLPELDTAPKPMVTLDPGGTTPDGRLILTKTDYDDYLSNYRKARTVRLERSKKRNRNLGKRIENFRVEPQLCLRDETCMRASLRTI